MGILTATVLLTLLPGQDKICVIMTSISQDRKAGVILAAGLCTGVLMSLMNPKLILFFLAFLPQFVDIQVGNTAIQMIILGVIFIVESFVFYLIVSALASRLTNRFMNSPRAAQNVNILASCVYVGIGISVLFI